MPIAQLVLDYITELVWPLILVGAAVWWHRELKAILRRLTRVGAAGGPAEFTDINTRVNDLAKGLVGLDPTAGELARRARVSEAISASIEAGAEAARRLGRSYATPQVASVWAADGAPKFRMYTSSGMEEHAGRDYQVERLERELRDIMMQAPGFAPDVGSGRHQLELRLKEKLRRLDPLSPLLDD